MPSSVPVISTEGIKQFIDSALEEDFIIIESEPKGNVSAFVRKVMGDVTSASAGRQAAIGGVTGYVAGYLTNKVGRAVGLSLAGTFIIFQIAQHKGYVKVDWAKVKRAMTKAKAEARKQSVELRKASVFGKKGTWIRDFAEENFFLSSGFMGGFAVGFFF